MTRSTTSDFFLILSTSTQNVFFVKIVDDIIICGAFCGVKNVKQELSEVFTTTDPGKCNFFLGIKVDHLMNGLWLSHKLYDEKIAKLPGIIYYEPTSPLPMEHPHIRKKQPNQIGEARNRINSVPRSFMSSLSVYSTLPDISTAVSMLSKLQAEPLREHWKVVKYLVIYINGTADYGIILLFGTGQVKLDAWIDSDLAWAMQGGNVWVFYIWKLFSPDASDVPIPAMYSASTTIPLF